MKNLMIVAVLSGLSGVCFAEESANYVCQLTVMEGTTSLKQDFKLTVPGSFKTKFAGTEALIFGNKEGRLNIRLSKEGQNFPYSNGFSTEFPKSLSTVLATAGGVASALRCDKK